MEKLRTETLSCKNSCFTLRPLLMTFSYLKELLKKWGWALPSFTYFPALRALEGNWMSHELTVEIDDGSGTLF